MAAPVAQVVVRGDISELSPNRRIHFRTRATRVKRWRDAAAWTAKELGWKKTPRKVRLSWIIRHWRKSDHAQLHGTLALKSVEDGLVDAGIVPDDNEEFVVWGEVSQETGSQFRFREEVVCVIEVLEESNVTKPRAGKNGHRDPAPAAHKDTSGAGDGHGAHRRPAKGRLRPAKGRAAASGARRKAPGGAQ